MIDLYQFIRLLGTKIFLILVGLFLALTGCVESRPRYSIVLPMPTIVVVPVKATPVSTVLPEPTATPQPSATPVPLIPTPIPIPTIAPTPTPISVSTPVPTIAPTVETEIPIGSTPNSGTFNLSLDFEGIGNESVVRSDRVLLHGVTSADATVSVNGVILEVQSDGTFELTLPLEPGPNIVDIVASDLEGNSINSSLAIISIPEDSG
ncbi:uncharacterized protein METZ01_LOCUS7374 [marine metagenome]|uniref:Bacterial Ig-like domain-containing protein n=1 Tax=marine metagenome TaxID=408172 RepID=A0A381NIX9_9ZZZZ